LTLIEEDDRKNVSVAEIALLKNEERIRG